MIFVTQSRDKRFLEISFKYPVPYHTDRIRKVIGARFDADRRVWTVPVRFVHKLEEQFRGELVWVTPRYKITGEEPPSPPPFWKDIPRDPVPGLKLPLYPFQNFGAHFLAYVAKREKLALLCDEMGLGKTPQAIAGAELLRQEGLVRRVLVITLSPLKHQWKEEGVEKFTDHPALVITGSPEQRKKLYESIDDYPYVITSYELVLRDQDILKDISFDLLILDEAHKIKNRAGKMNKAVTKLKAKYRFYLTGTPIMNRPEELIGLFKTAKHKGLGSYVAFRNRYLNVQTVSFGRKRVRKVIGYQNLDELRDRLLAYMLRRTNEDVAQELPEKREIPVYVEMTPIQAEVDTLLREKQQELLERAAKVKDREKAKQLEDAAKGYLAMRIGIADAPELFLLSPKEKIRKEFGPLVQRDLTSPKLERLIDIVQEILENGEQVVIFSQFKRMVKLIERELMKNGIPVVTYHGGMDDKTRLRVVRAFREGKVPVLVATEAGSTGLNLQVARYLINVDLPWNPAIWSQRKGRIRRLGSQHKTVTILNFIARGSIDEDIYKLLRDKEALANNLVENSEAQALLLAKLSGGM